MFDKGISFIKFTKAINFILVFIKQHSIKKYNYLFRMNKPNSITLYFIWEALIIKKGNSKLIIID